MNKQFLIAGGLALAVLGGGYWWMSQNNGGGGGARTMASDVNDGAVDGALTIPTLSAKAQQGKALFDANCAACHGANAAGTDRGPPFIHQIYRPGHHADAAFLIAAKRGVQAHHWRFGNMPPVKTVTNNEVTYILAYVREIQRANGVN